MSGIGYVFEMMNTAKQQDLLVRLILRSKLVERLLQASQNGKVDLKSFLYMLSESTYIRRSSNIKRVLCYLPLYSENERIDEFVGEVVI